MPSPVANVFVMSSAPRSATSPASTVVVALLSKRVVSMPEKSVPDKSDPRSRNRSVPVPPSTLLLRIVTLSSEMMSSSVPAPTKDKSPIEPRNVMSSCPVPPSTVIASRTPLKNCVEFRLTVSSPMPRSITPRNEVPFTTSLSAPPSIVTSPEDAVMVSSPAPPVTDALPELTFRMSLPVDPKTVSSAELPL